MSVYVTSWVWKHSKSAGVTKLVLLKIADNANEDGTEAWPSIEGIATQCGVSRSTVKRAIAELQELGEVSVELNAGGSTKTEDRYRPNRYTVYMTGGSERTVSTSRGFKQNDQGVQIEPFRGPTVNPEPSIEPSLNHPPIFRASEVRNDVGSIQEDFDKAWEKYPRKVDKTAARAKFIARVRSGVPASDLIAAALRYADLCRTSQTEAKFILHGSTFFGPGERWKRYVRDGEEAQPNPEAFYDEDGEEISEIAWTAQRLGEMNRDSVWSGQ